MVRRYGRQAPAISSMRSSEPRHSWLDVRHRLIAGIHSERRQFSKTTGLVSALIDVCLSKCSRVPAVTGASPLSAMWGDDAAAARLTASAGTTMPGRDMNAKDVQKRIAGGGPVYTPSERVCMEMCVQRFHDTQKYLLSNSELGE